MCACPETQNENLSDSKDGYSRKREIKKLATPRWVLSLLPLLVLLVPYPLLLLLLLPSPPLAAPSCSCPAAR